MNIDAINGEWFYDDVTPRGVSFDGLLPRACKIPLGNIQDFELIHTPRKMAEFQSNDWYRKNWSLADTLMTFSPLHSKKSALVDNYREEINKILSIPCDSEHCKHDASSDTWSTRGSCRGLRVLKEDLSRYGDVTTVSNDFDEGKFYDVKKEIYRLTDRVFAALAKCYEIKPRGTFAILDELCRKKIISSEARYKFASASAIAIKLRLSTYLKAGKQGEQLNSNSNDKTGEKAPVYYMPTQEELFHFFFVAIPLYDEIRQFTISGDVPSSLADCSFFNDSDITKGHIYCRLLKYDKAIECYERAGRENPENLNVEIRRIRAALFATHNPEKSENIRENLDNLLRKLVKNFSQLDFVVKEKALELTPLMNCVDVEECRQLIEGLLYANNIYDSPKYFEVANKILFEFFLTSNKSESKESAILLLALLNNCNELFQQNQIEAVVFKSTSFIDEEGVSTRSIVMLNNLGEFLFSRGKLDKAYRCFQRALSMQHLLYGNRPNVNMMTSLLSLGVIASELSMLPESRFYLESLVQLLKSFDGIKPKLLLKETYLWLSLSVRMDYTLDETLRYLKNGLKVTTGTTNERELLLNCLLFCELATIQECAEQAWEAILNACLRNCTNRETRAKMISGVAGTLCEMKKSKEGIELLKEELQKFTLDSQNQEKAFYLKVLGKVCLVQGLAEAKSFLSQASDILVNIESEDDLECLIGLSKAVIIEGDVSKAKQYLDKAFTSAVTWPPNYEKILALQDIAEVCENISAIALARQCYDEALKIYKEESNISNKVPVKVVYLEIKLGHLTKKMLNIDLVERIHYDRAAVILRQHVTTRQVDSTTILLFKALAQAYRSIDGNEEIRLLLESLKVSEFVYGEEKSQEMVSTLEQLSYAYFKSGDLQSSMKYMERRIKIELQQYSSNPFNEHITNILMEWALDSFDVPSSNDSIEGVCELFSTCLNDKAFLLNTTAAKTIAAKCFTFIAVLFYTSGDFEKAKSLNEKASQLFGEVQGRVKTERDPWRETRDLMKTIFSSEMKLPSHRKDLETLVLEIGIPYPDSLPSAKDMFIQDNSLAGDQELKKDVKEEGRNTLVVEQSTLSPLSMIHIPFDALEYYKSKGEFQRAAEIHDSVQLQLLTFYENSPLDGKEKLISEATEAKDKNQPSKAIMLLDLALQLPLPEGQCRRAPKILKLRGECFLSMGHFRSAAIDFTKANNFYSIETINNRQSLCEYSEVLIGLVRSEILCNNIKTAWLVCEKGIKLVSDHELKETINQQAVKLFYLGAKCVKILSERGEDKENKLVQARSLCQEALSLCDLMEEVGSLEEKKLKSMQMDVELLLASIYNTFWQKNEDENVFQEMKTSSVNCADTGLMRNTEPELLINLGIDFSQLARFYFMCGDIKQFVDYLNISLDLLFSTALPDYVWFYEEFVPLLLAVTASKSNTPDQSCSPFQQAVDMCMRTLKNQNKSLNYVNQFLTTLITIYRSLGQAQEAMVVAEIGLAITDLICNISDSDKLNSRCTILLHLAQIHQQNASNLTFDADEELKIAEKYYLSDRGQKEEMFLRKDVSYANFLCERKRFAEAINVLQDMRNLDELLRSIYVHVEYFSCAFYGAGVEKSVKIDGELFTTVGDVLYNLLVRAYVGMGKKKEAVATCEILTDFNLLDVHEASFGKRPSCKPYLVEDCHREVLSLLSEEDRHQFQNCDFPLSSANLAKLYYMLGEYEMAVKYFPENVEASEMLEMKISCLRLAGNELVDLKRGDYSISIFQQFLEILQVKEVFLDKPFSNQCKILQTYYFSNQYYLFRSLGRTHSERENIDAAIQCYERCVDLDEDFTCGQNIVAILSELYQTKALTVDLDNEDSRKFYMDLAWELFQKLFQKTAELTAFVELTFASLLTRQGLYEKAVEHFDKVIAKADYQSFIEFGNVDKPLVDVYLCREIEALRGSVFIPEKVLAVYELILTLMKLNQIGKAKEVALSLESVVEEYPLSLPVNELITHSMAGYAYKIIGNNKKAAEIFESVLQMNPGHTPVIEALESCGM